MYKIELGCKKDTKFQNHKNDRDKTTDPTGRLLRKVNICDVHKFLPSELIVSCIPDEQVFARRGKYINDPCILRK